MDKNVRVQAQTTRDQGLAKAYFPCALHASGACKHGLDAIVSTEHLAPSPPTKKTDKKTRIARVLLVSSGRAKESVLADNAELRGLKPPANPQQRAFLDDVVNKAIVAVVDAHRPITRHRREAGQELPARQRGQVPVFA